MLFETLYCSKILRSVGSNGGPLASTGWVSFVRRGLGGLQKILYEYTVFMRKEILSPFVKGGCAHPLTAHFVGPIPSKTLRKPIPLSRHPVAHNLLFSKDPTVWREGTAVFPNIVYTTEVQDPHLFLLFKKWYPFGPANAYSNCLLSSKYGVEDFFEIWLYPEKSGDPLIEKLLSLEKKACQLDTTLELRSYLIDPPIEVLHQEDRSIVGFPRNGSQKWKITISIGPKVFFKKPRLK